MTTQKYTKNTRYHTQLSDLSVLAHKI